MALFTVLVKIQVVKTNPDSANRVGIPSVSVNDIVSFFGAQQEKNRGKGAKEHSLNRIFFLIRGSQSGNLSEGGVSSPGRGLMVLYYN